MVAVRQQRQGDECHGRQQQARAQLRPGDTLQPAVQRLLVRQQKQRGHRGAGGNGGVAQHGKGTQREGHERCHEGRGAQILVFLALPPEEDPQHCAQDRKGGGQQAAVAPARERTQHTAKEPDQRKRPKPRRPLALLLVTLAPAPLEANDETNGKGKAQAKSEVQHVHDASLAPMPRPRLDLDETVRDWTDGIRIPVRKSRSAAWRPSVCRPQRPSQGGHRSDWQPERR